MEMRDRANTIPLLRSVFKCWILRSTFQSSIEKRLYCLMLRIYVTPIRQQVTSTWCRSYDYSNLEPKSTKGCHYPTYKTVYNYIAHSTPSLTKTNLQNHRVSSCNRNYLNCIYLRQKRYIKVTNTNPLHNYTVQ
jgi:hypothetical protein